MCLRYYTFPDVSRMRFFRNRFVRGSVGGARSGGGNRKTKFRTAFALYHYYYNQYVVLWYINTDDCISGYEIRIWFSTHYHSNIKRVLHILEYIILWYEICCYHILLYLLFGVKSSRQVLRTFMVLKFGT